MTPSIFVEVYCLPGTCNTECSNRQIQQSVEDTAEKLKLEWKHSRDGEPLLWQVAMVRKVLQIATLGKYANERVDHVLMKKGADTLVLICTESNIEDVERIKELHRQSRHPIESVLVNPWKYAEILTAVLGTVLRYKDHDAVFNISCGTIAMRAACHMAAVLIGAPAYFVTEEEGNVIGSIEEVKPLSPTTMTSPKVAILKALIRRGGRVAIQRELCDAEELCVSSISKHIRRLEQEGYVSVTKQRGRHSIEITELGRVVLSLKETRRLKVWGR